MLECIDIQMKGYARPRSVFSSVPQIELLRIRDPSAHNYMLLLYKVSHRCIHRLLCFFMWG